MRADPLMMTSFETRSGWLAASITASSVESRGAMTATDEQPAASRTAMASSTHCSRVGGFDGDVGSDSPIPRASNSMTRQNDDNLACHRASDGSSSMLSIGSMGAPGYHNKSPP